MYTKIDKIHMETQAGKAATFKWLSLVVLKAICTVFIGSCFTSAADIFARLIINSALWTNILVIIFSILLYIIVFCIGKPILKIVKDTPILLGIVSSFFCNLSGNLILKLFRIKQDSILITIVVEIVVLGVGGILLFIEKKIDVLLTKTKEKNKQFLLVQLGHYDEFIFKYKKYVICSVIGIVISLVIIVILKMTTYWIS